MTARTALFGLFPNIQPNQVGGVELSGRLAWDAARQEIRARGETAALFCYNAPDFEIADALTFTARGKGQALWRMLRVRVRPRIILVWHMALLQLVPFLRAPNARIVVFLHGIEAWRRQNVWTRRMLPRVNLFLANSRYTYERFLNTNPHLTKVAHCVVPLGADSPTGEIIAPTHASVLMVSRLERGEDYKGHRQMLGVWTRVRAQMNLQQIPDAQLWIAGEGDLRADLEHLARAENVRDSVQFFGRVSDARKQELLRACRAFAMPSRGEGFGLVYVEAMRAGRPCLVSDADAGREVVNPPEAGLAVNPDDADALVRAVVRLLTPGDEWHNLARAAQKRYVENFTAAHFQQRFRKVLAGVC